MDNIKRAGAQRRDANASDTTTTIRGNSGSSTIRAGMLTAPHQTRATAGSLAANQSDTPYDNSQGTPTTPTDLHPNAPSPSPIVEDAREDEVTEELGAPGAIKEGLGGGLNMLFGCGEDDPGCNA